MSVIWANELNKELEWVELKMLLTLQQIPEKAIAFLTGFCRTFAAGFFQRV